jgi:hypothetical protein
MQDAAEILLSGYESSRHQTQHLFAISRRSFTFGLGLIPGLVHLYESSPIYHNSSFARLQGEKLNKNIGDNVQIRSKFWVWIAKISQGV